MSESYIEKLESDLEKWKANFDMMASLYQVSQEEVRDQKKRLKELNEQLSSLKFKLN